jgi:hypothetical protein
MHAVWISSIVFVFCLAGAAFGHWLRDTLPAHHLDEESKDTVKVGVGLVATMTALVLGLVTASAKSSFDAVDAAVKHTAVNVLAMDRLLARYGPETAPIRATLKQAIEERMQMVWAPTGGDAGGFDPMRSGAAAGAEALAGALRRLAPADDAQRALQAHALDLAETLLQDRWEVFTIGDSSIPTPFLVVLLFWLVLTFASFGMFAPRNALVFAVLFVCALSVASAVFLILELDSPFHGVLTVSSDPVRYVVEKLNH